MIIIISLMLLFIFGLMFFGLDLLKEKFAELRFEKASINSYITNCLKNTAEEALILLGKQGGYINPEQFIETEKYKVSYLYNEANNSVPEEQQVETQLSAYIENNILICLNNFEDIKKQGWKVEYKNPKTTTQINIQDVSFTTDFVVDVRKREALINLNQFTHTADVRLSYILDIANETVNFHLENPEWTDLTALSKHDVEITIFPYQKNLMYSIKDEKSRLSSKPYLFNFVMNFPSSS